MKTTAIEDLKSEKDNVEREVAKMLNELTEKARRVRDELGFNEASMDADFDFRQHSNNEKKEWEVDIDITFQTRGKQL